MSEIDHALELHQAGRLPEAETLYRRILAREPEHADALHRLGVLTAQQGNYEAAADLIRRAITANGTNPEYYNDLGIALHAQGQLEAAATTYRQAIALAPSFEAYGNLGNALQEQNAFAEAITAYRQALALKPDAAGIHARLGDALKAEGQLDAAVAAYRQALALAPNLEAYNALGAALYQQGRFAEAIVAFEHALALKADAAEVYYNLGNALRAEGRNSDAIIAYRQALRCKPDYVDPYNNLGVMLQSKGELSTAVETYRQALALEPNYAEAQFNLGIALQARGEVDDATAAYRRTLDLRPEHAVAHSYLFHCMHYSPACDAGTLFAEARKWNADHALSLQAQIEPHHNDRTPDRRLRIGYVSDNLRQHPVGFFLAPVVAVHDKSQVEVFCYADVREPDGMTQKFVTHADHWRDIAGVDDSGLATMIRADQIDILVDLDSHSKGNRLLAFARKPAPVQVTVGGHYDTTGLDVMDYLVSDRFHTPPGSERYFSEELVRLPDGYVCYGPPAYAPPVGDLPMRRLGYITFGCFNQLPKVTAAAIALWAQILKELPQARLKLRTPGLDDSSVCARLLRLFEAQDIAADRIHLAGETPHPVLLAEYGAIDIALDPLPYSGCLTTCEALWMGVPVVTLSGDNFARRHSTSHLSNVGLSELVGATPEQYVAIATELAGDTDRLLAIRRGLRDQMAASPLCDAARYTRDLEAAYRRMWVRYCGASS